MGFFQPGDATGSSAQTPAPAQQALAKFKADILGQLLNASGGQRPTFASFAKGGPATNPMPQGLGGGIGALLQAMNQPGAFTSTGSTKSSAGSPSMLSDIVQLGVLAGLLGNVLGGGSGASGGLGNLGSAISNSGFGDLLRQYIGGPTGLSDYPSTPLGAGDFGSLSYPDSGQTYPGTPSLEDILSIPDQEYIYPTG